MFVKNSDSYGGVAYDARNAGRTPYSRDADATQAQGYMTPGYDPNRGIDDFRREQGGNEVGFISPVQAVLIQDVYKRTYYLTGHSRKNI